MAGMVYTSNNELRNAIKSEKDRRSREYPARIAAQNRMAAIRVPGAPARLNLIAQGERWLDRSLRFRSGKDHGRERRRCAEWVTISRIPLWPRPHPQDRSWPFSEVRERQLPRAPGTPTASTAAGRVQQFSSSLIAATRNT